MEENRRDKWRVKKGGKIDKHKIVQQSTSNSDNAIHMWPAAIVS